MRPDLEIITEWILPGTRVLDLGCGDGTLLEHLHRTRQVTGYGLEIDDANIARCIERGVQVIKTDLDAGLADFFDEDSFDYVVMTQTLQAVYYPASLLDEMLRVGREGIVTFPNIGHWQSRLHLALGGRMPITRALPSDWYDTPNIHLCSLRDFEDLCQRQKIAILERTAVDYEHRTSLGIRLLPNLLGEIALYRFCRRSG
ncbi:MAG: methionine biosynthesis protein MetW [Gammaproteobacteria bacterium]|nr:methionine biosynthesis protein MetW [Gammaproteobacteria bacterium]